MKRDIYEARRSPSGDNFGTRRLQQTQSRALEMPNEIRLLSHGYRVQPISNLKQQLKDCCRLTREKSVLADTQETSKLEKQMQ